MVKTVTCPEQLFIEDSDNAIFLAGGITGCDDWQNNVIDFCNKAYSTGPLYDKKIVLVNPRRPSFDVTKKEESIFQIQWEYEHLRMCKHILFWFPKSSICPITLFELGAALEHKESLFVGCEKGYPRLLDVETQVNCSRPGFKIYSNLYNMVSELIIKSTYENI